MIYKKAYAVLAAFRWFMMIFYLGLAVAFAAYSLYFGVKVFGFLTKLPASDSIDAILQLLGLIDSTLVASLVLMVILSGFTSFIAPNQQDETAGSGAISFGELKLKFVATLAVIGAINILESVLESGMLNSTTILLQCAVELTLIIATLAFAYSETQHGKQHASHASHTE